MIKKIVLIVSAITMMSTGVNADSALRIACDGSNEGAAVYINGKYKGECPTDLFLSPGDKKLRAVKKAGKEYEKVFEKNFYLVDDSAKKIEVILSEAQLTASAIKARRIQREKEEKVRAQKTLERARKGELKAMDSMARYYDNGTGVKQSSKNASYWRNQARLKREKLNAQNTLASAKSGNKEAMEKMAQLYEQGKGVEKNSKKAFMWRSKIATSVLRKAEAGDTNSMRKVASYYKEGYGLERSNTESSKWYEKANKIERERKVQAEIDQHNKNIKEKIARIDFTANAKDMTRGFNFRGMDFFEFWTVFPSYIVSGAFGLVSDALSAPTKTMEKKQLENQLKARASKWNNPNSMVAKAYQQRYEADQQEQILISSK